MTGANGRAPGLIYASALALRARESGRANGPGQRKKGGGDYQGTIAARSGRVARKAWRRVSRLTAEVSAGFEPARGDST